jgi:glycerol-3-phosphate dehydrogenase
VRESSISTSGAVDRRAKTLAALAREPFDLLVVGGGINGAGIARDAAMRGLRTAMVERGDFACGTSSRSSKLIHGGLRYLEQGHVRLVLEAVRERERLRTLAPHLVRPQEFVVPIYRGGPVGFVKLAAGLMLYDVLAGFWSVKRHSMLGRRRMVAAEPALRQDGLVGGGRYWDYRTDDARLVLETALAAAREGAVVVSYAEVAGFLDEGGRIAGARVVDRAGGGEVEVHARVVVNAAGPWVDEVAALDDPTAKPRLRLTKGVHIVVPRNRVGNRAAIVLRAVRDGRVMFVIPWGEHSLVGTTDTDHPGGPEQEPVVEPDDVAYLLETVNHYFPDARLGAGDVVSAFAGLRPLIAPAEGGDPDPSDVSREEEIFESPRGLVTIAGGKLTAFRLIAETVVDRVIAALRQSGDTRRFARSKTAAVPLPGGGSAPELLAAAAISHDGHGLAPSVISHLADRYGTRLDEVMGFVVADRMLARPLVDGLPDPRAEVVQAVEHEWGLTLEDVLRRRTQVALLDGTSGADVASDVASIMASRLGWTREAAEDAVRRYLAATSGARARWR